MGTFLLSDLSPEFLQPPSVQVACGGAEREADYSLQHTVKHAEMQTTEIISGEKHPLTEGVLKPVSSPYNVCFGGGHSCSGN